MGHVGADAQVDEGPIAVDGGGGAVGNLGLDKVRLVLAVLEHLEQVGLGQLEPLKALLVLDGPLGDGLERLEVGGGHGAGSG